MHPRFAIVLPMVLASACGGSGSSPAAPSAANTPSLAPGPGVNMTLLAQIDTATLTSRVLDEHGHVHAAGAPADGARLSHDEEIVLPGGAASGSGNWGYTAPDGRRLALTGTSVGLSIVDVTDPARARNIGLVPGPQSTWREVKTFEHYAYVTTEAKHGLEIVDLSDPDQPRKVQTWTGSFKSAHTLWIDAERRLLFANGAGDDNGRTGLHVLSLANPEEPEELGRFTDYYVHDSFTRGDVLFASAIFDGWQALVDTSNPRRPREITRFFTGRRFTHNAALTPDGRYLFTTDERQDAPVEGWDIADPRQPVKVSEFIARPGTIAHNVQIDGSRLLVAHYTEGVVLLNIADPRQPRVLGSYDTYLGQESGFHGAWGAYLFPGTNMIVVSDIEGGLFVVRQN
jgi:choice-of-anchor B domain-containing protein